MASMEESSVKTDGQLWSVWAENIGYKTEENEDDGTEEEKKKRESDAMKLRQEDMPLFGFCPAWDDFYLVVCELCSRVIKPQALKNHIELRHGNSTLARGERHEAIGQHAKAGNSNKGGSSSCQMALGRTSSVSHSVKSNSPSQPPSRSHTKPGSSHCHGNPSSLQLSSSHNAVTSSKSKPENSSRLKKNSMAPFVRVERMPDDILKTTSVHAVNSLSTDKKELPSPQQPPPPNLNISSLLLNISGPTTTASTITITTTTTTATTGQSFPSQSQTSCFPRTLNSGPSENCSMPLTQMGADSVSSDAKRQSTSSKNKKVPKERKLLLCKDREYDPNKHCGVKVAETGKPCTRSLTCKTHSLSLRRAVVGRKKNFDELLQDHRAAKEAAQKASQSQASGATQHQTNDSCQISHGISESVGIPNASTISSKPGSGTKSSGTSSAGLIKSANKQMLKHNKHASTKAISPAIPVNRPSSHNVEPSKPPSLLPENQLQQRLQESAAEPSAPKLTPQDTRYITHHPRPSAICTFGLRQLGNGLFLLDRRWDLPRAAFRAAVCTERANHPPPLKKLCIESKLPPVPEPVDPNDPYSFTCSEPSSSQPSRNSSSVIGDIKTVVSTSLHSNLARSAVTVNSKSCLSNSSVSTGPKSFQSKPVSNKVKVREKTVNVSRNGSGGGSNPAKKKRNTAPSSGSTSGSSVNRTSNMSFPATTGGVALTTQTLPLLPLTIGDHLGALSQLQVSTHLVANRNNLTISPAVIRSQGMATIQSATSGRGTKDGTSVVVTGVDVLNGQLPVPSALLHSVTVSRPCGAMPTLLATSGGLGITVGTTGLVGQLSHIQKTANTSESELTTPVLNSSKGSNKKANAVASVGVPNSNLTTTCTAGSTWSSAKAKAKIRKPSSGKSVILNHTTAVTHISGVGLLLESGGNVSANNGGINNHTSPQMLSSPSATPSPLLRSDSVSPQVPVSSPLHNGLGPSPPPPPFLSQKGLGSNASGTNIVNHTASVSPASRTSTPSPSTDLSSPGSTGSGPKGKSSGRHSGNIQKIAAAATSGSGHGTFHLSMPPPVSVSALPVVTSGTMSSSSLSYQQVFTKQMLTNDQLTQLQIQTVGKHNTKSTTASSRPSSLTLATAAMPLYPGLLTASGIVPTTSSSSLRQQQRPLLLQNEESRRTAVQMQGSPSLPT